jgi:hypothetical protein
VAVPTLLQRAVAGRPHAARGGGGRARRLALNEVADSDSVAPVQRQDHPSVRTRPAPAWPPAVSPWLRPYLFVDIPSGRESGGGGARCPPRPRLSCPQSPARVESFRRPGVWARFVRGTQSHRCLSAATDSEAGPRRQRVERAGGRAGRRAVRADADAGGRQPPAVCRGAPLPSDRAALARAQHPHPNPKPQHPHPNPKPTPNASTHTQTRSQPQMQTLTTFPSCAPVPGE